MQSELNIHACAQNNLAKLLRVESYSVLVNASDEESKSIVRRAQKTRKKARRIPVIYSSGNPYVMLGRKINSKGKYVK